MKRFRVILLTLIMAFSLAIPCFAADDGSPLVVGENSYPVYTSDRGNIIDWVNSNNSYHVLIYEYGSSTRMVLAESPLATFMYSIVAAESTFVNGANYHRYTLVDGAWVWNESKSLSAGIQAVSVDTILASSRAMNKSTKYPAVDQHSRFRGALPEMILEVAGEQLKITLPDLVGTMKTLVLCGVGCLALLIVLNLFGKRSLIFLRK